MNERINSNIPDYLKPFLWSYDLARMDLVKHKRIIIRNILDYGTEEAVNWLRTVYSEDDIKEAIRQSVRTEWSKKSINLWSLIYDVKPKEHRF